jgi:phosphoribosylaminoimidazolecarboxamide formyltransferase / IMP cyclohydrolase
VSTTAVRRALLAVYDKTGVVELARALRELGVELVSSGGTAAALRDAGIEVTPVEEVTGFPELLGGRVKTLHPAIHAGLLADRRSAEHVEQLRERGIEPLDLVVVNLYPFRETVGSGAAFGEVVEKIDIGGPAMARAAAKNFESVGVVVDPIRYETVLDEIRLEGGLTRSTRLALAAEAFAHSAAYDAAVAAWFAERATGDDGTIPAFVGVTFRRADDLRYGENPHQRAALFEEVGGPGVLGGAEVLQGKAMSFNNWLDADSASALAAELPTPAAVIVKHNNPCGAAIGSTLADAYARAFAGDEVSAFGGVVAFNGAVDADAVAAMRDVFTEVVIAPSFSDEALEELAGRKNVRVVQAPVADLAGTEIRPIRAGVLVQDRDVVDEDPGSWEVVSARAPDDRERRDLAFAWTVVARVRSNAIVLARELATVGIGAGQMSRVDASVLAVRKAGPRAAGAVLASDAFFPFPDAVEVAADAGVTAIAHPGGSAHDDDVLAVADARGIAVVLTGRRHFRH